MDWIKVVCNILDNRKIKMIRKGPEGDTIVLLWILMLIEGGKCNRGGYLMISDNRSYTPDTISMVTDIPLPTVQLGLAIFLELEMIDNRDGAIFIKNWWKYQSEDKLAVRRENDRLRQQRHRDKQRTGILALPKTKKTSRDSHVTLSRDVTQENREEKNRKETTTDIRLLFAETPLEKISEKELKNLQKRYGLEQLLKAADIAAETWRRNREDLHNPAGYLNSLCTSLIVPEWYVPFSERMRIAEESEQQRKSKKEEQAAQSALEEKDSAASEAFWASLDEEKREEYLTRALAELPEGIQPGKTVSLLMAKSLAWTEAQTGKK
ncbi:MAG: phage replisome organizer N-terminal domain-containing protein [Desulfobulbaceae bacterium]|nr:phage replisome organizer N-terminal domain-containing protein [Desulfobulbaceae bacterium]